MSGIPQMDPGAFFRVHRDELAAAMTRVMDSGRYILGGEVAAFEQEFAQRFGFPHAAAVASGTDAIALALQALGIGPGDKVATVSHTAVATVVAILMTGATPVFLDIDPVTYTVEPAALAARLEFTPGIKAVIAVHLYGHPADVTNLGEIAGRFGVRLVED
jgi:dTDP-4-amino-4,6-dideoxygalactose transaminase